MPEKLEKLLNKKYFNKIDDYYEAKAELIEDINKILAAEPFGDVQGVICGIEVKKCLEAANDLYESIQEPEDSDFSATDL